MTTNTSTNHQLLDLDELKRRHPLEDEVRRSGVELRGHGRVLQGLCPFHEDRVPSFTVYRDTSRFMCFGCGVKGDVIDFVRLRDGVGFPVAVRELDTLPRFPSSQPVSRTTSAAWHATNGDAAPGVPAPDPAILTVAMDFYGASLEKSPDAQSYLMNRHVFFGTAKLLKLGFSSGSGLRQHLARAGFSEGQIACSGLFMAQDRERFEGMTVVPEIRRGKVVWLTGRAISPEAEPRFQSLPGRKPLLGLGALEEGMPVVLTEGLFDWVVLKQWGLNAVATLGTHVPEETLRPLTAFHRVFVAFDSDEAGRDAAKRALTFLGPKRAVPIGLPPGCKDVADLASRLDGPDLLLRAIAQAERAAASCSRGIGRGRHVRKAG